MISRTASFMYQAFGMRMSPCRTPSTIAGLRAARTAGELSPPRTSVPPLKKVLKALGQSGTDTRRRAQDAVVEGGVQGAETA